jgi:hypothetical protein
VSHYLYKEKLDLEKEPDHFDIRVIKNVERFEVPKFIKDRPNWEKLFKDKPKYGDKFGPSYSTQMFWV